ncbi:MAG: fold metallo-hydrolase [Betaproteobacteria bacterium]|jgi:7,8-dihydropterin-6-yl-methyl-4-(beta-D-ribofuranosyl)aminobenzene 5'-phosphate synthase|nr:fold metallo-hydrolase [Betaproteobacteria bacterium]
MTMSVNRRQFILGSAAVIAQMGLARHALTQAPKRFAVPTVDSLTIRVITDSTYDTDRPGSSKWVKIRRTPIRIPAGNPAVDWRRTLHNEWGLALALESRMGPETRHLLLDFGFTPNALLNNMEYMGIDGAKMQGLIMSHGHNDHFGGLPGYLDKFRSKLPDDLALYAGGEDNFCNRVVQRGGPGLFTDTGVLDRRDLEKHRVKIVSCEQPTVIMGHAFSTGMIARSSFERVGAGALVEYYKTKGVGCDLPDANAKAEGKPVADQQIHEHGTCFNVKDRGLVVISSCGHAGIINTVRQAMEVSGVKKVHAALGGFHLFPAPEDYLRQTVAEMKTLDPDVIIPMHCSGPGLIALLRTDLADRVLTSTTGTEYTFGA